MQTKAKPAPQPDTLQPSVDLGRAGVLAELGACSRGEGAAPIVSKAKITAVLGASNKGWGPIANSWRSVQLHPGKAWAGPSVGPYDQPHLASSHVQTLDLGLRGVTIARPSDVAHARNGSRGPLDDRRLTRVLGYIEQYLTDDMTVVDLADVACLSVFHFTRAFSAAIGMPPHRYVSQKRLEHAKEMIATGRASIAETALICRFSSQSSFTRAFRRATGMTPAMYRRAKGSQPSVRRVACR